GSTDKPATAQHTYVFTGWQPEIAPVTEDATYTAQYDEIPNDNPWWWWILYWLRTLFSWRV
ncbi:MAG: hypothetical protein GX224_01930, partial [Thermoplasmatales archaeon]|nr:hypothetical protein [Thermoplasmatales archaeon]